MIPRASLLRTSPALVAGLVVGTFACAGSVAVDYGSGAGCWQPQALATGPSGLATLVALTLGVASLLFARWAVLGSMVLVLGAASAGWTAGALGSPAPATMTPLLVSGVGGAILLVAAAAAISTRRARLAGATALAIAIASALFIVAYGLCV